MTSVKLGRLESVELRKVWENEAGMFTPWLAQAENLNLLGDTIGIDLELEAQEKSVGPFRADILCKDTASGDWVLIENQLEKTDHTHLGQIMTYAAGLKAVTIVWIANRFTDEHRAALDWLNDITDDRFNFFGLEVELWQIGNSDVAPKFNIACKPNEWIKGGSGGGGRIGPMELTPTKQLQLEFWKGFRGYLADAHSSIKATKPLPQHWMTIALGRTGSHLNAICSAWDSARSSYECGELRAEVVVDDQWSKAFYQALFEVKDEIEAELGESLIWHNPPGNRMCRIYTRVAADVQDRNQWSSYFEWLKKKLEALHEVFSERVKQIDPTEYVVDESEQGAMS